MSDDVDQEIAFHFDMTVRDLMAKGMSEEEAKREATRRFGDVEATRARLRSIDQGRVEQQRRAEWFDALRQDIRYAWRGLRASRGFTAIVLLTIALAIGANATMFGILDAILLRAPAGLRDPDRLARVYVDRGRGGFGRSLESRESFPAYLGVRDHTHSFENVAAFVAQRSVVGTGERAEQARTLLVSGNYFATLGVGATLGRTFQQDEDRPPARVLVAVISDSYWRSHFGASPSAIGSPITVDGQRYTIVGVTPEHFNGTDLDRVDVWLPMAAAAPVAFGDDYTTSRRMAAFVVFARLRPDVAPARAESEITAAVRAVSPDTNDFDHNATAKLSSIILAREPVESEQTTGASVATWLAGVAAVVLLIACANVANLLLARTTRRRREIAVRLALGVSRRRLVSQLMTESLLLAMLGGALGLVVAQWGGTLVRAVLLPDVAWSGPLVDVRVIAFAAAATLLTGLLTGLAPVLLSRAHDLAGALKAGTREGTYRRSRVRSTLLLAQAMLSVVLLVGAGLFVRSLHNVRTMDYGYDPERLLVVDAQLQNSVKREERLAIYDRMLDRAQRVPGVQHAALSTTAPFWMMASGQIKIPGVDSLESRSGWRPLVNVVTPDYFRTMGTRLVRGRLFTAQDIYGAPRVILVNQALAKAGWKGQDPVGKCAKIGGDTMPCSTVVGVVRDALTNELREEPIMQFYVPMAQRQSGQTMRTLLVRAVGEPKHLEQSLRRELMAVAPGAMWMDVQTVQGNIEPQARPWQLGATLFTVFGALALLVASIGLYGAIAYNVTQRTHEMGVRVALGAQRADVLRMILGEGLRVAVVGVALGSVAALIAGRWVTPLLFDVSPRDPVVFGIVSITLLAVAILASLLPAWRATRVDPNVALRAD